MKIFIRAILLLLVLSFIQLNLQATTYGSDTAVSIVNPFSIPTSTDNIIKTFGCVKNGFAFTDAATTCSFQSIFPVAGPISLKGGTLYLMSDLTLANTGTFADLGTIRGANHVVELSQYNTSFSSGTQPNGKLVLNSVASATLAGNSRSFDWSYDGKYLAVGEAGGSGKELAIYQFNGTTLTLMSSQNLPGNATVNSVRWRPNSYYLALADSKNSIRSYLFVPPSTLTTGGTASFTTPYAIAFQKRGAYVAVAGTASTVNVYSYTASGGGSFSLVATSTNTLNGTVQYDAISWAPVGNKNDIIVATNNGGTTGSLHLYNFTGAAINHLKEYAQSKAGNTLDWAATSTYMAVGFADGTIRTYQHTAASNVIVQKQSYTITGAVNSVNFKSNATELAVGRAVAATNQFQIYLFNTSSYALSEIYPISVTTDAFCVRYYTSGSTSYVARSDNSTARLNIYKESYSPFIFRDVNLFLNNDLTLGSPLTFTGNCAIIGRNNKITFTSNGSLNVSPNSSLNIKNTTLNFRTPSSFALQGGTSKLTLNDSEIALDSDIVLTDGRFDCYGDFVVTGPHTMQYSSAYTSTVHSNAILALNNGAELKIGKSRATTVEPLYFDDVSAQLSINNATLHTTNSGLKITKGTVNIFGNSNFTIDWTQSNPLDTKVTATNQGLAFGDGVNISNNPWLILNGNGTTLNVNHGGLVLDTKVTYSSIKFYGQSQLSFSPTSTLYIKQPVKMTNGWLTTSTAMTISTQPNVSYFTFNNTRISDALNAFDYILTGSRADLSTIVLDKNDSMEITRGSLPRNITVARNGNIISGNGSISGSILFMNQYSTLTRDMQSNIGVTSDIYLRGGRMTIGRDSGLVSGYTFKRTGTIDLISNTFNLAGHEVDWDGNLYWMGNEATIKLNADTNLTGIWTFSGSVLIDGRGYELDLESTGTIILERGAKLTFKNIKVENISRHNGIVCRDNLGKLIFDDSTIVLGGNYLFDKGGLYFSNNNYVLSNAGVDTIYTLTYDSTQTSTIYENATLSICDGVRFTVGRKNSSKTVVTQQPIVFGNADSILQLNGGTLHITSSGMIMTVGKIQACNNSYIEIENTKYPYGLTVGDGTSVNDFEFEISSGANLALNSGVVFYRNYSPNRIVFDSPSSVLDVRSNGAFTAKTNVILQNGTLNTDSPNNVAVTTDSGIVAYQLNIIRTYETPYSSQRRNVHGLRPYILNDGDYYYIHEGTTTNQVIASAGTSTFGGSGIFSGTLSLKNNSVTLQSYLDAPCFTNIALNGGKYVLFTDGYFAADKTFTGSGTVQLQGTKLSFGNLDASQTNTIYWKGQTSGGIKLNAKTSLSSTWTFGGSMSLNGNGNILDLTNRGALTIRPNSTLSLENVVVKGLGTNYGSINFMDDTATLILSNAYLGLENNLSTTIGGIYVNGPSCVGLKNYNWTLDQNASMTIKGAVLWQEGLGQINHGKIKFGSGSLSKYLSLVSSGTIKTTANLDMLGTDTTILQTQIRNNSNAVKRLADHFIAVNDAKFYAVNGITGSTTLSGRSMLESPINLQGGTLTLNGDMILSSQTTIPSSGNFDLNGCAMILGGDLIIPDNVRIKVASSGIIDGQGNNLDINTLGKLSVDNGVTLTLRNINLLGHGTWPIEMRSNNSALTLQDAMTIFDRDFTFSQGNLFIKGDVVVTGSSKFSYASTGTAFIQSHSTLCFDKNTTFSYSPRLTGRHTLSERNLIKLADRTSEIFFDECALHLPDSGWRLTTGTIYFDNLVTVNGQAIQDKSFEFGDGTAAGDLDVQVLAGASVNTNAYIYLNNYAN